MQFRQRIASKQTRDHGIASLCRGHVKLGKTCTKRRAWAGHRGGNAARFVCRSPDLVFDSLRYRIDPLTEKFVVKSGWRVNWASAKQSWQSPIARHPISMTIPCHRIVPDQGCLRWLHAWLQVKKASPFGKNFCKNRTLQRNSLESGSRS